MTDRHSLPFHLLALLMHSSPLYLLALLLLWWFYGDALEAAMRLAVTLAHSGLKLYEIDTVSLAVD